MDGALVGMNLWIVSFAIWQASEIIAGAIRYHADKIGERDE